MLCHNTQIGRRGWQTALGYSLSLSSSFAGSPAYAQAPAQEQAVTWTADDAQLKWGACPPFLPKGCGIAVLHGDPARDNVDVFLKVPAKSSLPSTGIPQQNGWCWSPASFMSRTRDRRWLRSGA